MIVWIHSTGTYLTIWRPNHDLLELLKEGLCFNVYNLSVSEVKGHSVGGGVEVMLSANKNTVFQKVHVDENTCDLIYEPREVSYDT